MDLGDAELQVSVLLAWAAPSEKRRLPGSHCVGVTVRPADFGSTVMASQPSSSKKKEEKGKNIQVVVRCR